MKALVHTGPFKLEFTDVPDPDIGDEDVIVRVKAVGICGSDIHGYSGKTGRRIPPCIMGHEAAGVVEIVGPNVNGIRPGDRVCFDSTVYCNQCHACRQGIYNHCDRREVLGVSIPGMKRNGAMAELLRLPWWTIHPMPEMLSFVQASMLESVSIAYHAVKTGNVQTLDTVLIIGAGTIGLFVLQAVRLNASGRIIVSDINDARLRLAGELGADLTVNPERDDLVELVESETDGKGSDVSFEVVGFAGTLQQAIAATGMGGRVICVGNLTKKVEINVPELISKELTMRGSYASSGEYSECIDLVAAGRIDVLPLVSEIRPLSKGQEAFDRLYKGKENLLKVILEP